MVYMSTNGRANASTKKYLRKAKLPPPKHHQPEEKDWTCPSCKSINAPWSQICDCGTTREREKMLTDSWTKREKLVGEATLQLLSDPSDQSAMGLVVFENGEVTNELWTKNACKKLTEAGEMKLYDSELCATPEDLSSFFAEGEIAF